MARKILLADDSVTAQNMGRKILADAGYEVLTVNNGSAALKKIAEAKPDLIVLDVYMPGYSGLEVCQRLKEASETARIPVLLTVGKLEPFKPEEAKRVRAEGFIIKPFEASELLSALTKLEDKIVPRAEASKPGRFARAIAAVEEGRYDDAVKVEEDKGWKERIAFPSGKRKSSSPEADADDPAIYNPVNKDLRTVVERKPAPAEEHHDSDTRFDLGALAPQGLPKDVTPEEIAALAAAAARIQNVVADPPAAERHVPKNSVQEAAPETPVALSSEAKSQTESEPRPQAASEAAQETAPAPVIEAGAAEKHETVEAAEQAVEPAKTDVETAPAPADVMVAIASLEPVAAVLPADSGANGSGTYAADEPMTMAAAAGAQSAVSRWTAVAVAPSPEESSISLESEMQKAYAAFAAADAACARTAESVATVPSIAAPPVEASAEHSTPASEPYLQHDAPAGPAPADTSAAPAVAAAPELTPISIEAMVAGLTEEPAITREESAIENPVGERVASIERPDQSAPEPAPEEPPQPEAAVASVATTEEVAAAIAQEAVAPPSTEATSAENAVAASASSANGTEAESSGNLAHKDSEAATTAAAWASWRRIRESGDGHKASPEASVSEPTNPESTDLVPTNLETAKNEIEQAPAPLHVAAMAVAAGAEKSPEAASAEAESPDIASIVDSVLADLRPKIVEEISRKLGKKKQPAQYKARPL